MNLCKIRRMSGKIGQNEIIWRIRLTIKMMDYDGHKERRNPEVCERIMTMASIKTVTRGKVTSQFSEEWSVLSSR